MPFEAGKPRPEKSGRKPGSPNKKHKFFEEAQATIERLGFNAMEALVELAHSKDENIRLQAAKEVCRYVYVQKRAVELTGQDGGPIKVQEEHPAVAEFKDLVKTLVDAKVKS